MRSTLLFLAARILVTAFRGNESKHTNRNMHRNGPMAIVYIDDNKITADET